MRKAKRLGCKEQVLRRAGETGRHWDRASGSPGSRPLGHFLHVLLPEPLHFPNPFASRWLHHILDRYEHRQEFVAEIGFASSRCPPFGLVFRLGFWVLFCFLFVSFTFLNGDNFAAP